MPLTDADKKFKEFQTQMESTVRKWNTVFENEPGKMAEFLTFGSRFYRHSLRDNILIYDRMPDAHYCQSFEAWQKQGYSIRKNEKGIKVYVPVETVVLNVDGTLVPLEHASKEERLRYQAGEIGSITKQKLGIKTVFDVSQTTYPAAEYYKLFHSSYPETTFKRIEKGIGNYALLNDIQMPKSIQSLKDMIPAVTRSMAAQVQDPQRRFGQAAAAVMLNAYVGLQSGQSIVSELEQGYRDWKAAMPDITAVSILNTTYRNIRKPLSELITEIEQQVPDHVLRSEPQPVRENIYDKIKQQVSIIEYAKEAGYTVKRIGSYYTTAEHDSIRFDPNRNCYWQNSIPGKNGAAEGDSVIGFAAKFVYNGDMHAALKDLTARVTGGSGSTLRKITPAVPPTKKTLKLPARGQNMHRVYAYLTQSRYIDQDVVQDFVNQKMLYQDRRGNCVFVSYGADGKPVFASFRGTLSDIKFLGDVPGSDYAQGFYINHNAKKLIITESVIDAMSVMSILHGQGLDYKEWDYLPLNGATKHEAVLKRLKSDPKEEVLLALDHDVAGVKDMARLRDSMINVLGMDETRITNHVPEKKDWNADLASKASKFQSLKQIPFLTPTELPRIHYCAVQSTEHQEEKGFHKRNGQEQYRLVELLDTGDICPMDIKRNVIFRTPEEVRGLIPAMYEEVDYDELIKMKREMQEAVQQNFTQSEPTIPEPERNEIEHEIKGYHVAEGIVMADIVANGIESEEAVWSDGERKYIVTGYAVDHSYHEYNLTESEQEDLKKFIEDQHIVLDDMSPMLILKMQKAETIKAPEKGCASFLDTLQKQNFTQSEPTIPEPELNIGMG